MGELYRRAFSNPGMTTRETNAHWKREQDNYLNQIGAMDLIKKDPMASLGYKIRSANPNMTLEMGSNLEGGYNGLYQFLTPKGSEDYKGPRFNGTMDVAVGLSPRQYGATIAHELGHVGSRNSQSDRGIKSDVNEEERRQRMMDYVNNPAGSEAHEDALWFLSQHFGMSFDDIDAEAEVLAARIGRKSKKKLAPTKTTEWDAADWEPEEGENQ
jgi:hypothetical protein